ncbi:hypothetical protein [Aeromicrobium endophyticum]|uniref:Transmembrane protein n=1 Tax=Aeromicrobium endophyticum TaxID=2292704 RepID=A0A371NZE1_9ACTN|nr:hypothetical protein [Aeromicrobium endophyticum]REK69045.1 hypothetical protein DX116_19565 [Aeromicrobium endophyticum]
MHAVDPEPVVDPPADDEVEAALEDVEPQTVHAEVVTVPEVVHDEPALDEPVPDELAHDEAVAAEPVPLAEVLAAAGVFDRPAEPAHAEPAHAEPADAEPGEVDPAASASARGSDGSRDSSTVGRSAGTSTRRPRRRDRIVEAPRGPKTPLSQRLRSLGRSKDTEGRPQRGPGAGRKRIVSVLAGLVGAVGLLCSVVLAFGALLVALDATGSGVYDSVASLCDVLVGPLRDAVSFTGTKADMKESLVAWGAGAIVYLVVGIVAQSLLRSTVDD